MMILGRYFDDRGASRVDVKSFAIPDDCQGELDAARDAIIEARSNHEEIAMSILAQRIEAAEAKRLFGFLVEHPGGVEIVGASPTPTCFWKSEAECRSNSIVQVGDATALACPVHGIACGACGVRHRGPC